MRGIGTFNHRRQLRVANAGFHAGSTDGARANAHFNDISAGENQFFTHLTGHYVAGNNGFLRPGGARFRHKLNEVFRVAVSHVYADEVQLWILGQDLLSFFKVRVRGTGGNHHMLQHFCGLALHKRLPFFNAVVFVHGGQNSKSGQGFRHAEGTDGIHVSSDNRYAGPGLA